MELDEKPCNARKKRSDYMDTCRERLEGKAVSSVKNWVKKHGLVCPLQSLVGEED